MSIRSFLRLEREEKKLFWEALILHLWTGLLLKVVPFKRIPLLFKSRQSAVGSRQSDNVALIKDAVQRAGRVSPWRNRCLVSSLVAKRMLNRRNIPSLLSLGVSKDSEGRVIAHAWLKSGEYELVRKDGDYAVLYTF